MRRTLTLLFLLALSLALASATMVTGKVVGEDGQPIKGVNLLLHRFDDGTTQSLVSDVAGGFAMEVDLELLRQIGAIGSIVACAPGYALADDVLTEHDNVITLCTGTTLTGTVVDAQGKPLAGIPVRLLGVLHNNGYTEVPEEWCDRFTITSAANGAWTLPGIPPDGIVSIALADDRYVHEQRDISLVKGKKAAPVSFMLRPGAVLTGRILTPEGKPAEDARITIFATNGHKEISGETAADGSYCFTGLTKGTYTINANSKTQAWITDPLKVIVLVEGKKTIAADLRTRTGAVLDGMLEDAETGKAITGRMTIELFSRNTNNSEARRYEYRTITTDKQGHFLIRTLPGRMWLLSDRPPPGYLKLKDTDAQRVDLHDGKITIVVLQLHKGQTVTGAVTDEKGQPVAGAQFAIDMQSGNGNPFSPNDTQLLFTTDQYGHFEVAGLPVGKGTINLFHDGQRISAWEQSASQHIDIPAQEPIAVTVTSIAMRTLTGRVVDMKHQPLAGVTATFSVPLLQSIGSMTQLVSKTLTVTTDEDGRYHLDNIPVKRAVSLLSLEKTGYRQILASSLTSTGNGTIDDAVMSACDATVRGKVCDAGGKPVKGATLVSAEGGLAVRTVTDNTGAFTLTEQPEGVLHLIAATLTGGGLATCTANDTHIILTWVPAEMAKPTDLQLARQLLEADSKLPKEQRRYNRTDVLHEIADRDLALANKLALSGEEPLCDGLRAYLLGKQAEENPAKVPEVLAQLNMLQDPDCKLYAAVEMGIAVTRTMPDLAEQLYQIAKSIYDHSSHDSLNGFTTIEGLGTFPEISLRTVALAELLHKTADVDAMLAQLSALARHDVAKGYTITQSLFAAAGRVSPEFVVKVYQSIDTTFNKNQSLNVAVESMAQHDPVAAQRLLKMIEAMNANGIPSDPRPVILALGKHDPAAALALAKTSSFPPRSSLLLAAAAFQPKAAVRAIVREVFSEESNRTMLTVAQVNAIDPELGKELYLQYKQTLKAKSYAMGSVPSGDHSWYAYLISSIDPVEARLILETEYAAAFMKARHDEQVNELQFLSTAMYAIDINRAQAMLKGINGFDLNSRQYCWQRIMHYILMSREERAACFGST